MRLGDEQFDKLQTTLMSSMNGTDGVEGNYVDRVCREVG
jgi:hypothetical protein